MTDRQLLLENSKEAWSALPDDIVLFGGSFDPVQSAHLEMVRRVLIHPRFQSAVVVFVPANRNPHKQTEQPASNADRLDMLMLGIQEVLPSFRCVISAIEFAREGVSYTLDTVRAIRPLLREGQRLFLLMGGDSARAFLKWKEPEQILRAVSGTLIVPRSGDDMEVLLNMQTRFPSDLQQKFATEIIGGELLSESSSAIRALMQQGKEPQGALPTTVLAYIQKKALYQNHKQD